MASLAKKKRKKKRTRPEPRDLITENRKSRLTSKQPRPDRHKLVALALASLVAGLLLVINGDRVTNVNKVTKPGESQHGFPFVYLTRQLEKEPVIFIHGRTYSWPLPPVKGEIREWSFQYLALDLLIVAVVVTVTYWLVSWIVFRYDRWKYRK